MLYMVNTAYEFHALIAAGVEYVRAGTEVFFNLIKFEDFKSKIRLIPNICYAGFPRSDGVCGQWIRPEDLKVYERYAEYIEFQGIDHKAEEALYRIYIEQHEWPGECDLIWNDFNVYALNRMIGSDISTIRLSCGQECQRGGRCKICQRAIRLANPELIYDYQRNKK